MGRGDPLETAALMVLAAHLLPDEAMAAVHVACPLRRRLRAVRVEPGAPADLVAIPAASVREAIASQPSGRITFKGGTLVSGSTMTVASPRRACRGTTRPVA